MVDPTVSRTKFEREIENHKSLGSELRSRGWLLEAASFPLVRVTYLATNINPPIAPVTVELNFENYNLVAPSVKFLHPVTFKPVALQALRKTPDGEPRNFLIPVHPTTNEPFLCLPGVREYHNHPQHSGDSWDLHRYTGEGSLFFLLDHIWAYAIRTIRAHVVTVTFAVSSTKIAQEADNDS